MKNSSRGMRDKRPFCGGRRRRVSWRGKSSEMRQQGSLVFFGVLVRRPFPRLNFVLFPRNSVHVISIDKLAEKWMAGMSSRQKNRAEKSNCLERPHGSLGESRKRDMAAVLSPQRYYNILKRILKDLQQAPRLFLYSTSISLARDFRRFLCVRSA